MADLDDPSNIKLVRRIINRKPFLKNIYKSFYQELLWRIRTISLEKIVVELGSGAGFLKAMAPNVVTSDILPYPGVDCVFSALEMPFQDNSIGAFLMIDVLHHVKDSNRFFQEIDRCLELGGKVVMIEPANTLWSQFIYTRFHHEPFEVAGDWGFEEGGPLSGANMAIPWIVFCRDQDQFKSKFPHLVIRAIEYHTPLRYLISGGLSVRQLLPSWCYTIVMLLERLLSPFDRYIGLFMTIELEKIG
ncbi:class I SAM-dependent methyltransferase [Phormidium tenue FACHB-886]|nr:class I SAM-dependent methyltransferase [Phormidium tenue FACHB-886]